MELLDGDTLRDRLKAGPLPLKPDRPLALLVVNGLAAAHEKGSSTATSSPRTCS